MAKLVECELCGEEFAAPINKYNKEPRPEKVELIIQGTDGYVRTRESLKCCPACVQAVEANLDEDAFHELLLKGRKK